MKINTNAIFDLIKDLSDKIQVLPKENDELREVVGKLQGLLRLREDIKNGQG